MLKVDLEGNILWGWGHIPGPTAAVKDAMLRAKRDIQMSLLLGDARMFVVDTQLELERIATAVDAIAISTEGAVSITIDGKTHRVRNTRNLQKLTKRLRNAYGIRVFNG